MKILWTTALLISTTLSTQALAGAILRCTKSHPTKPISIDIKIYEDGGVYSVEAMEESYSGSIDLAPKGVHGRKTESQLTLKGKPGSDFSLVIDLAHPQKKLMDVVVGDETGDYLKKANVMVYTSRLVTKDSGGDIDEVIECTKFN